MLFSVSIDYTQISVCDGQDTTFSQWSDEHVAQGFVWRENHVSFGVPDHDGLCLVETQLVTAFPPLTEDVLRAIATPLSAPHGITIATIMQDYPIADLPGTDYEVQFRLIEGGAIEKSRLFDEAQLEENYAYLLQFLFRPGRSDHFEILRKSGEMTTDRVLTKEANPV